MQVYIATYTTGEGDSFSLRGDTDDLFKKLGELHGGTLIEAGLDCNECGDIRWIDNCDCEFIVQIVTGEHYDDKPRYLSRLVESFDIYVATRANAEYWAGEVNNGYEEGSHEHIVYAGEIKLCVDKYTGKEK